MDLRLIANAAAPRRSCLARWAGVARPHHRARHRCGGDPRESVSQRGRRSRGERCHSRRYPGGAGRLHARSHLRGRHTCHRARDLDGVTAKGPATAFGTLDVEVYALPPTGDGITPPGQSDRVQTRRELCALAPSLREVAQLQLKLELGSATPVESHPSSNPSIGEPRMHGARLRYRFGR